MRPELKVIGASIFLVALSACAPVQQQSFTATPVGQPLIAGVGDVVLRMDGREGMPNIFGNADIFGRTRPTGFATVQYGGMQGEKVVLLRSGVVTQSDATTMNSTPLVVPTQQSSAPHVKCLRHDSRERCIGAVVFTMPSAAEGDSAL